MKEEMICYLYSIEDDGALRVLRRNNIERNNIEAMNRLVHEMTLLEVVLN